MAFNGYLIKVNGTLFPTKYIASSSYKTTPNQRLDVDSGRVASGVLQRDVCAHMPVKIEFETLAITNDDVAVINDILGVDPDNLGRDATVEYYDMETDSYKTADCYMPNPTFSVDTYDSSNIYYLSVRYAFIEY